MKHLIILLIICLCANVATAQELVDSADSVAMVTLDVQPKFMGGNFRTFSNWIAPRLEYPEDAFARKIEATIPIMFVIEKDGSITNVECRAAISGLPKPYLSLIKEAKRVVASSPKWTPAIKYHEGKPDSVRSQGIVRVSFSVPEWKVDEVPVFPLSAQDDYDDADTEYHVKKFGQWIRSQLDPDLEFKELVYFTVVIEKDGAVSNPKLISTPDAGIAEEIIRIAGTSPKWRPAVKNGNPVRKLLYLPMNIKEIKDEEEPKKEEDKNEEEIERTMPVFQGGDLNTFRNWAMRQLVYPQYAQREGIQGTVLVAFIIDKEGKTEMLHVISSPHPALTQETISVVKKSPKWTPGNDNGKLISVYYILPIDFLLE